MSDYIVAGVVSQAGRAVKIIVITVALLGAGCTALGGVAAYYAFEHAAK